MIKDVIASELKKTLADLGFPEVEVVLGKTASESFGDYSTNVAMVLAKQLKKNPKEIADGIASALPRNDIFSASVINGFINFTLSKEYLMDQLGKVLEGGEKYGKSEEMKGKKIMIEFAHPNTHKMFHIGHLRNITTGECVVRMLEASGAEVIRANYEGDVGLHIAKCLYTILKGKMPELKEVKERVEFLGKCYSEGNRAYEEDETAKSAKQGGVSYSRPKRTRKASGTTRR